MNKVVINRILIVLLLLSLVINILYLRDSKRKYVYIKDSFTELHREFGSTLEDLYKILSSMEDSGFKDKDSINEALHEASREIMTQERKLWYLSSLSEDFKDYYHHGSIESYLYKLEEKDTFTEEDFQKIREIYRQSYSVGSKDVVETKFLYKVVPSQAFNEMSENINDIVDE